MVQSKFVSHINRSSLGKREWREARGVSQVGVLLHGSRKPRRSGFQPPCPDSSRAVITQGEHKSPSRTNEEFEMIDPKSGLLTSASLNSTSLSLRCLCLCCHSLHGAVLWDGGKLATCHVVCHCLREEGQLWANRKRKKWHVFSLAFLLYWFPFQFNIVGQNLSLESGNLVHVFGPVMGKLFKFCASVSSAVKEI